MAKIQVWNVDIHGVTITFSPNHAAKVKSHLPGTVEEDWYGGWIEPDNPSRSQSGFYIAFQSSDDVFFPDFHNLPFYYQQDYKGYMERITRHVQRQGFPDWAGHGSPLPWTELMRFVECLASAPM